MLPDNHPRLSKRPFSRGELLADAVVHIAALVAGLIAFAVLFARIAFVGTVSDALAMAIYAAGFFLLFGFSLAYNMTPPSPLKWLLRRFDHSAIYLMIAGVYTAAVSQMSDQTLAWTLIAIVWGVSLVGVALKLALPGRLDGVSLALYLGLGWIAVAFARPLIAALPTTTLWLMAAGGLVYTVGVVFYKWDGLKFQNAIWHGFVATASGLQYAGISYALGRAAI